MPAAEADEPTLLRAAYGLPPGAVIPEEAALTEGAVVTTAVTASPSKPTAIAPAERRVASASCGGTPGAWACWAC